MAQARRPDPGLPTIQRLTSKTPSVFLGEMGCFIWHSGYEFLSWILTKDEKILWRADPPDYQTPAQTYNDWVEKLCGAPGRLQSHTFILALLFIFRLKQQNPWISPRGGSEYRILATSLILANKYLEDEPIANTEWKARTGVPLAELGMMEADFLSNAGFTLYVSDTDWSDWLNKLDKLVRYFEYISALKSFPATLIISPSGAGCQVSIPEQTAEAKKHLQETFFEGLEHLSPDFPYALPKSLTNDQLLLMKSDVANVANDDDGDGSTNEAGLKQLQQTATTGPEVVQNYCDDMDANIYRQLSSFIESDRQPEPKPGMRSGVGALTQIATGVSENNTISSSSTVAVGINELPDLSVSASPTDSGISASPFSLSREDMPSSITQMLERINGPNSAKAQAQPHYQPIPSCPSNVSPWNGQVNCNPEAELLKTENWSLVGAGCIKNLAGTF